jgi:hypothetical protein
MNIFFAMAGPFDWATAIARTSVMHAGDAALQHDTFEDFGVHR